MKSISASSPLSVAVVIVNYGTADLAADAVRSVLATKHDGCAVEVHLLDNHSPKGDAEQLRHLFETEGWAHHRVAPVTFYAEQENHGFGRGNNVVLNALAARAAPPDYVLLLNPDARLEPGALETLARFLQDNPAVGCAGAQISKPDSGPVTAAFRFPTALVEFISAANIGPLTRLSGNRTMWMDPTLDTQQVDWVAGAAVMLRMKALQEVGFFDPDFFLYFEEVELMHRLHAAGWPCWHVPQARVIHHEGAATGVRSGTTRPPRRPGYWYHSQAMYFHKTASRPVALARALARLVGSTLHVPYAVIKAEKPDLPQAYFRDYLKGVLLPLMGLTRMRPDSGATPPAKSFAQALIDQDLPADAPLNAGTQNRNPPQIGFWSLLKEDLRTHEGHFFAQGFWALFWHRFGNWRMGIRFGLLRKLFSLIYRIGAKLTQWFCGIDLPYTVVVGRRVKLEHFGSMILIARAIGDDVVLRQNTTMGIISPQGPHQRPVLGDGVDVGVGCALLGGITVGRNTIVGAHSLVIHDQPADAVIAGTPAKVIKRRSAAVQPIRPELKTSA